MSRNRFCAFIAGPLLIALIAASHPVAHAQTFSILYNFGTNSGDPAAPQSPGIVAQGRDGNLYSTAEYGAEGCGAIFEITPAGTLTDLHDFDRTDGCDSYSGLTLGTDGNFYGTASAGGAFANGDIFQVAPGGGFTAIHMFGKRGPGAGPRTAPVQGLDGNFYGTTFGTSMISKSQEETEVS